MPENSHGRLGRKEDNEKWTPDIRMVGINGVAYHFDKFDSKLLTELLITVNKLSIVLLILPITLIKLPKIPFVRIYVLPPIGISVGNFIPA
jgi:hypothetical protein